MQESNVHDNEITLKDFILKMKELKTEISSKWKLIFFISFLFSVLGLLYSIKKLTYYKADLNFVVEDNSNSGGVLAKYSGLASQFGFDTGLGSSTTFSEGNMIELITSRRIVESALLSEVFIDGKKDLLINYHIDINNYREKWIKKVPDIKTLVLNSDRSSSTILADSILAVAWKDLTSYNLKAKLSDESNIISVSCKSKNELFAMFLVEALVAELKEYYTYIQTANARNTLDFIQNRADSVLNELKIAELSYARHKDSNFGVMRAEGLLEELRLKREVEILNLMYGEIIKNLEVSKVTLLNQKPLINIIDSPRLPLEVITFSKLKGLILFGLLGAFLSTLYVSLAFLTRQALEEN